MRLAVEIGPDPDSDVRAAAAQPRRGPHGARPPRVARSLLSLKFVPVVLLTLVSSMSACVVPVAPTFQDPIGEPNVPPFIVSATPEINTFAPSEVQVTVTDQNVGDYLYYQWVVDYPAYSANTRDQGILQISPSVNGSQLRVTKGISPCILNPVATIAVHQLEFILADREFDQSNSMVLDALPPESDGFVVRATWTFSCP
jgi:hypothetical protein